MKLWTAPDWLAPCVRLGDTVTALASARFRCGNQGKDLLEDQVTGPFFGLDDLALFTGDVMLDPAVSVVRGLRMVVRTCLIPAGTGTKVLRDRKVYYKTTTNRGKR